MIDDEEDHDPWNEPSHRHPRARKLMTDEVLWDCVNELAPFGSDEGADAYEEFRSWRAENPGVNLTACLDWILMGKLEQYTGRLAEDDVLARHVDHGDPEAMLGLDYPDIFTLDATIIATVLGQLICEGGIDPEAKPFARIAIRRQSHPAVLSQGYRDPETMKERVAILESVAKVIEAG